MLLITHGWKKDHFGGSQQYSKCLIESLNKNKYNDLEIYNINPYIKQNFNDKFNFSLISIFLAIPVTLGVILLCIRVSMLTGING